MFLFSLVNAYRIPILAELFAVLTDWAITLFAYYDKKCKLLQKWQFEEIYSNGIIHTRGENIFK